MNDVVLAAISGAFRDLLLSRGEEPAQFMMPSLVPVSVRAPGEENIYENRVSGILAYLPVNIADPVDRLTAVRAEISALKASHESKVMESLVSLGRFAPYPVASVGVQLAYSLHQREIVTVTTNVPGPRQPLYGMGRRLVEIIPYVPIATTMRTGVSIFTYCDEVTFGITGDYTSNPDIEVLSRGIENGLAELLKVAEHTTAPPTPPVSPPEPAAKASAPKTSAPRGGAPKTSAARVSAARVSAAKASTARTGVPQASAPKTSPPKTRAPRDSTPKTRAPRASAARASTATASTATASTATASTAKASTAKASTAKASTAKASTAKASTGKVSTRKVSTAKVSRKDRHR